MECRHLWKIKSCFFLSKYLYIKRIVINIFINFKSNKDNYTWVSEIRYLGYGSDYHFSISIFLRDFMNTFDKYSHLVTSLWTFIIIIMKKVIISFDSNTPIRFVFQTSETQTRFQQSDYLRDFKIYITVAFRVSYLIIMDQWTI